MVKDKRLYQIKRKRILITILLGFISFFVLIPFLTYVYFAPDLTSKETIMNKNDSGVILLDRNEKPFFSFYQAKFKSFVPLSEISPEIQHAVIAIEDQDFYNHPGFSFRGIVRAFVSNFTGRSIQQGGSTITQQLIKNSLLTPKKSYARKYQEFILAQEIERRFEKDEILEMYLNSAYFGDGGFGVGQASEIYFGKQVKDLSIAEAAMIAGVLPAPSAYSPISGSMEKAVLRQKLVLQKMLELKYITTEEYKAALNEKLKYKNTQESINNLAPHFALMVIDELKKNFGEEQVARSGFQVKTTLDTDWQKFAETTVKEQVDKLQANDVSNGAAVVVDPKTGEIRALVGSKDWYDEKVGKINLATVPRQPGSSFKPLVYAEALQTNIITAGTILHDKPTTFQRNYKPENYDKRFRGDVTLRRALANSLNVPAVEVMSKVGVEKMLNFAPQLGITSLKDPSNYGVSLVLGSGEVPLVEMTGAFATLANKGEHNRTISILEIKDKNGKAIFSAKPQGNQALDEGVAYIISSILSDNRARSETFGNALTINRQAAVKTGTAEDYRDALTIGYTPNLAVGVWVGNNDNTPMDKIAGSLGAAPIWRTLMQHYLLELPQEIFIKPTNIVTVGFCGTNRTATESAQIQQENFIVGTEPKQGCRVEISPSPDPNASPTSQPEQPTPTAPQPTSTNSPQPTNTPIIEIQIITPTPKNNDKKNN